MAPTMRAPRFCNVMSLKRGISITGCRTSKTKPKSCDYSKGPCIQAQSWRLKNIGAQLNTIRCGCTAFCSRFDRCRCSTTGRKLLKIGALVNHQRPRVLTETVLARIDRVLHDHDHRARLRCTKCRRPSLTETAEPSPLPDRAGAGVLPASDEEIEPRFQSDMVPLRLAGPAREPAVDSRPDLLQTNVALTDAGNAGCFLRLQAMTAC